MKQLPHFNSEDEERIFWLDHDSCDYFDLSKAVLIDQKRDMPLLTKSNNLPDLEAIENNNQRDKTIAAISQSILTSPTLRDLIETTVEKLYYKSNVGSPNA